VFFWFCFLFFDVFLWLFCVVVFFFLVFCFVLLLVFLLHFLCFVWGVLCGGGFVVFLKRMQQVLNSEYHVLRFCRRVIFLLTSVLK